MRFELRFQACVPFRRLSLWLRDCRPFRRVLERLREYELSLFEVAACLAAGTSRPLTPLALNLLAEEVERQENGTCETTLL